MLNGSGELTGSLQIGDWGCIETPVYLTSTHAVGRVYDGAVAVAVEVEPRVGTEDFVIPIVGECDDSWLSEGRVVQVEAEDVARAVGAAAGDAVPEGAVGAGTGMMTKGWKAGIGTASRIAPSIGGAVGVLVLSNFYHLRASSWTASRSARFSASLPRPPARRREAASASWPSTPRCRRTSCNGSLAVSGLGLARCGSVAHHGSGEIFVAFAPPGRRPRGEAAVMDVPDAALNDVFEAVVDASEEAVLNALWAAPEVIGREGRVGHALPHDDVLELLARHGRLG